jgi:hypothetical protein
MLLSDLSSLALEETRVIKNKSKESSCSSEVYNHKPKKDLELAAEVF